MLDSRSTQALPILRWLSTLTMEERQTLYSDCQTQLPYLTLLWLRKTSHSLEHSKHLLFPVMITGSGSRGLILVPTSLVGTATLMLVLLSRSTLMLLAHSVYLQHRRLSLTHLSMSLPVAQRWHASTQDS